MFEPKTHTRPSVRWDGMFDTDGNENDIWPGDTVVVRGATFIKTGDNSFNHIPASGIREVAS